MFENSEVGNKVWDIRHGWGIITFINTINAYPINVSFGNEDESFTIDGKEFESDLYPTLFWDEVVIVPPSKPNGFKGPQSMMPDCYRQPATEVTNSLRSLKSSPELSISIKDGDVVITFDTAATIKIKS